MLFGLAGQTSRRASIRSLVSLRGQPEQQHRLRDPARGGSTLEILELWLERTASSTSDRMRLPERVAGAGQAPEGGCEPPADVLIEAAPGTVDVAVLGEGEIAAGIVLKRQRAAGACAGELGGNPPFLDGQVIWRRAEAHFVPVQIAILRGDGSGDLGKPF